MNATFQQALLATLLANVGFALTRLPAGLLSDRIGRRTVMVTSVALNLGGIANITGRFDQFRPVAGAEIGLRSGLS